MKNYVVNLQNYVFCATFPNLRAIALEYNYIHSKSTKKTKSEAPKQRLAFMAVCLSLEKVDS